MAETTSADPQALNEFVRRAGRAREEALRLAESVRSAQVRVFNASPNNGQDVPAARTLSTSLGSMGQNEVFVRTVGAELLRADKSGGRLLSAPTKRIRAAVNRAGVGQRRPRTPFEPITSLPGLPNGGYVDDPISAANGNMLHDEVDLTFPGIASVLNVARRYNSLLASVNGVFGPGWASILDVSLVSESDRVLVTLPDGAVAVIVFDDEEWSSFGNRIKSIDRLPEGSWQVRTDDATSLRFDADGSLTGWAQGQAVAAVERTDGRVTRVSEALSGRSFEVTWSGPTISEITANDGRLVTYRRDGEGRLAEVSGPTARTQYTWIGNLLQSSVDADGVRAFLNEYDNEGRVVRQTSPFGRVTDYRYEQTGMTTVTDADGVRQAMIHDDRGNLTAVVDVDGSALRLVYDDMDRNTLVTGRDGSTTRYEYDDETSELISRRGDDGREEDWTYDDLGRVVQRRSNRDGAWSFSYAEHFTTPTVIRGPLGDVTLIEIDERLDAPRRITDPDGVMVEFDYDADGQVTRVGDALGGTETYSYDSVGRLIAAESSGGLRTTFGYDPDGRLIEWARGEATTTYEYSAAGRVRAGTEPGHVAWSAEIGPHGAVSAIADALGSTVRFGRDQVGHITSVIAPDGAVHHMEFNASGACTAVVDPLGNRTERRYDVSGNLVVVVDAEGRTLRREVDAADRTVLSVDPDGQQTSFGYHPNNSVARVTLADGRTWASEIDGAGRMVAVIDPIGGRYEVDLSDAGRVLERRYPSGVFERFRYDSAGRMVGYTDPYGADAEVELDESGRCIVLHRAGIDHDLIMSWNDQNCVSGITTNDADWLVERDPAGRITRTTDPTSLERRFEYDTRGLLTRAIDPAGGELQYSYDVCGRLVQQLAPGGSATRWRYNELGLPTDVVDATGVERTFEYDRTGHLVGTQMGNAGWTRTLDASGREILRKGLDGQELLRLTYDQTGRITQADASGWVSHYAWDPVDNLVSIEDGASEWTKPPLDEAAAPSGDDEPSGTPGAPRALDPAGRLLVDPNGTAYRYDAAGRLVETVPSGGLPWSFEYGDDGLLSVERSSLGERRFRYDEAGRLVRIDSGGAGGRSLGYDAAGRRTSEHWDSGVRVNFVWDDMDHLVRVERAEPNGEIEHLQFQFDAEGRPRTVNDQPVGPLEPNEMLRSSPLQIGRFQFLGARVLDHASHQFLSPDPLPPAPGEVGSASLYTHAWLDPVNFVDPSGLRPISKADFDAMKERAERNLLSKAVDAIAADPWAWIAVAGVVVIGAVICVAGAPIIGVGVLIGAGVAAGIGACTGSGIDPWNVVVGGVFGGMAGAVTMATAGAASAVAIKSASGGGLAVWQKGIEQARRGDFDASDLITAGIFGAATGFAGAKLPTPTSGLGNAGKGAAVDGSLNLGEQVTGNVLNGKDALDVNVAEVALTAGGGGLNNYVEHTQRPSTDLVVRPFAEIIVRPSTDLIVRPSTDLILRPRAEIVVRPTPPPTPPAKIDMSIRFSGNY